MSSTQTDVLVAGCGPVGLTAALLCAARGLSVTAVDAEPEDAIRPGSRAIFLHGVSVRTLSRADRALAEEISGYGLTWSGKHTLWAGQTVYRKAYPPPAQPRKPPFISLSQRDLEHRLRRSCLAAGVVLSWETPVENVTVRPDHVELGSGHRAAFLIGADGARSAVRAAIGARLAGTRSPTSFLVVDVAGDHEIHQGERVFHYRHPAAGGRHVLIAPFRGGLRVDLQCRAADDVADLTARVCDWIEPILPGVARPEITWTSRYRFDQAVADRFVDPGLRVLLVGEAAHLFAPFGARGLNSGIADAAAATDAIVHSLAGNPRDTAITGYHTVRHAAALRNRAATGQALHHLLATGRGTRARQRAAALAARHWQPAGAWLDRIPYGPRDAGIPGSPY
ncbi:MAG: FAD-dependent monooxygenase [Nocardia sp.]|nr:FAD-dependent monooxygenase [Nocardia sp.]